MSKSLSNTSRDEAVETRRVLEVLHAWGIHNLGQLAALERSELGSRLGPAAMRMWDRATANTTRLLKLTQPPESFAETFEFENEIETAEPLLFMLRRFLQQFSLRLSAHYVVAKELTLRITFSDKTAYEHRFEIPEPTNNVELLFRMLQTHLEDFKSEAPIAAVSLSAQPTKSAPQQYGLFETALRNPAQLAETLARLTALIGSERVGTPVLEDTFRADAFRMQPFRWELPEPTAAASAVSADSGSKAAPVLRRFRPAVTASVLLDETTPAHLRSHAAEGRVQEQDGPYRFSGNWWDVDDWQRTEWDLQLDNGTICRCHDDGEQWKVDGVYD